MIINRLLWECMTSGMRQPDKLRPKDLTIFQSLLLARASTSEGLYGYQISDEETEYMHKTGVYRVLGRLAERGLIASEQEPPSLGPPKNIYRITESGRELLAATALEMLKIVSVALPVQVQVVIGENTLILSDTITD